MFARIKKSGSYQYLQLVENRRDKGKVVQRVIATFCRMDHLSNTGAVDSLIRSPFPIFTAGCSGFVRQK